MNCPFKERISKDFSERDTLLFLTVAQQGGDAQVVSSQLLLQVSQLLLQCRDGDYPLVLLWPLQEVQHLLPQQQLQHVAVSDDVCQQRGEGGGQTVHVLHQLPVRLLQAGDVGQTDLHRAAELGQAVVQSPGPGLLRGQILRHLQDGCLIKDVVRL